MEADLRTVEGGRGVGADGIALHLAGRRIDARWHVTRDHKGVLIVDRGDRARDRLARRPLEAGAQHRVDDRARVGELRRVERLGRRARKAVEVLLRVAAQLGEVAAGEHVHLAAGLAQQPRGRQPVAAVVALSHHHADRARQRSAGHQVREPACRPLHQVERRHAALLDRVRVRGAHLLRRVGRVEPVRERHGAAGYPLLSPLAGLVRADAGPIQGEEQGMRIRKPSPSLVISIVALVMASTGSAVAAVSFARNSGAVDGRSAGGASSSLSHAAGQLVATASGGSHKGQIPVKFLANVPAATTFGRYSPVVDNTTGGSQAINTNSLGTISATCNDQDDRAGVLDPTTTLTFQSGGSTVNFARTIGGSNATLVSMAPNTTQSITINGSNTFEIQVEAFGADVVYDGQVRQDGRGTSAANCLVAGTAEKFTH